MIAAATPYDALTLREEAGRFKQTFDTVLLAYIATKQREFAGISDNPNLQKIFTHLAAICADGKRLRPFMVWTLYRHSHPEAELADVHNLLLAVELFHIFCLIHDDVMDEAATRHGVATLQQYTHASMYADSTLKAHTKRSSDSQAILAGDIVFNMVFATLRAASSTLPNSQAVQALFHTLVDEVCLGQMLDIDLTTKTTATLAEVVEKNRLKTAYYSFVRPLQLGALIGGRADLLPFIVAFGEAVGLLYQVEDDLLDIIGDPAVTKKDTFQDITQNQHTVLTVYLRRHSNEYSELLNSHIGKTLTTTDKEVLLAAFKDSGAVSYAEGLVEDYLTTARTAIAQHELTEVDTQLFISLLSLVTKRTT